MTNSANLRVIAPTLAVVDGIPTTTSSDVAIHFGKPHNEVLRRIRNLIEQLPDDRLSNFAQTVETRVNPSGGAPIESPAYRITRDGFTLLAMGFTGKKALAFKLAYIDAFNRMESQLHAHAGKPAMVINPPPIDRQHLADTLGLSLSIAGWVQQVVAKAVMNGGDDWKHQRWVVSFIPDSKIGNTPVVHQLAPDTLVLPKRELVDLMATITGDAWTTMRNKTNSRTGVPA